MSDRRPRPSRAGEHQNELMGIDDDAVLNRDVDAVQTEVRSHDQAPAVESDKPQGAAGPSRDLSCILDGQTDELPADLVLALETGPQVLKPLGNLRSCATADDSRPPAAAGRRKRSDASQGDGNRTRIASLRTAAPGADLRTDLPDRATCAI
jgi:hypothetical protein